MRASVLLVGSQPPDNPRKIYNPEMKMKKKNRELLNLFNIFEVNSGFLEKHASLDKMYAHFQI